MEKDVTIELTAYMRDASWSISEMVRVLRGLDIGLDTLNESVRSIEILLAEIRNLYLNR